MVDMWADYSVTLSVVTTVVSLVDMKEGTMEIEQVVEQDQYQENELVVTMALDKVAQMAQSTDDKMVAELVVMLVDTLDLKWVRKKVVQKVGWQAVLLVEMMDTVWVVVTEQQLVPYLAASKDFGVVDQSV